MRKSIKRAVVVGAVLAVTAGAGAAWAAWGVGGTGSAHAQAEKVVPLETVAATTDAALYPGAIGSAYLKIKNPNRFPVEINNITWKPADGVRASGGIGFCGNTGVSFGDFSTDTAGSNGMLSGLRLANAAGGQIKVGAGETVQVTLSKSVRMTNRSDSGCQGATFSIPISMLGVSDADAY
jgi:hypothetical protein